MHTGFICFYGGHYVCFFFNAHLRQWIFFDDSNVRPVGTLQQVKPKMHAPCFMPLMPCLAEANARLGWETEYSPVDAMLCHACARQIMRGVPRKHSRPAAPPVHAFKSLCICRCGQLD